MRIRKSCPNKNRLYPCSFRLFSIGFVHRQNMTRFKIQKCNKILIQAKYVQNELIQVCHACSTANATMFVALFQQIQLSLIEFLKTIEVWFENRSPLITLLFSLSLSIKCATMLLRSIVKLVQVNHGDGGL